MNFFNWIKGVFRKMIPFKNIEQTEQVKSPLSQEMTQALELWYLMYINQPYWKSVNTKSLNIAATISSTVAMQMLLEGKWKITSTETDNDGEYLENERSKFLTKQFKKLFGTLREEVEKGLAAGGLVIRPYEKDGEISFDFAADWSIYPVSFDSDGNLKDVIFKENFEENKTYYTRLERHQRSDGGTVTITNEAYKSSNPQTLGQKIPLMSVPRWAELEPETVVTGINFNLYGWFKVAAANNVDTTSKMGVSIFSKGSELIKEADEQFSSLLWEYKGGELAVDVDPLALKENESTGYTMSAHEQRLFRKLDLGVDSNYNVFSPALRDESYTQGLNTILEKIEDACSLDHGMLSKVSEEAKTATEIKIRKQRYYALISDNQTALEKGLKEVFRACIALCDLYGLCKSEEVEISFDWGDNVQTDSAQEMNEKLLLVSNGLMSKKEFRMWYFGETAKQAENALLQIESESAITFPGLERRSEPQDLEPEVPQDEKATKKD
jgi:A118 family predicted phage portal protein